jgi:uroporphyrinogen-III synthase
MKTAITIRILSTRHLDEEALHYAYEKNWHVDVIPFIEIKGIMAKEDAEKCHSLFSDNQHPIILIFSSMNGVEWFGRGLEKEGQKLPSGVATLCVGKKTANRAAEQLKAVPLFIADNSKTLLSNIKSNFSTSTGFIYPCAKERLDTLPNGLRKSEYAVQEIPVYESKAIPKKISDHYDALLFFSPSAVASFFTLNSWPDNALGICIGETTALSLLKMGVDSILVPTKPDEMEMIKLLDHYLT